MKKLVLLKVKAFTLSELLVVLVIIGILVLLALPNLMPLISGTRATEAKLQLKHLHTLQKSYFLLNAKYCSNLEDLGFAQEKLAEDGGTAHYRIEIGESTTTSWTGKAIAITDFDGDGNYNEWEVNQDLTLEEIVKD